jgi:3-deoxy-manno-octulosonate cytidylyltransferase (CMP-KDO synthetase)
VFHVVIPARFASTRLPGKPLLDIGGKPMIQRVVEQACASGAGEVLVATDDARIAEAVSDPRRRGQRIAIMTDPDLRDWSDETVVVNVQGDEPFLPPALVDQVADLLVRDPAAGIATLAAPIGHLEEFMDPNVVKVVTARDGSALYFSRAPIPWSRDGAPDGLASQRDFAGAMRHIGLYAYRVGALRSITRMSPSGLENRERLEQLRSLENGVRIIVGSCIVLPGPGVDTEADLQRARMAVSLRA